MTYVFVCIGSYIPGCKFVRTRQVLSTDLIETNNDANGASCDNALVFYTNVLLLH